MDDTAVTSDVGPDLTAAAELRDRLVRAHLEDLDRVAGESAYVAASRRRPRRPGSTAA
jgi:hypothetical protein